MNDTGPVDTASKSTPPARHRDPLRYWKGYVVAVLVIWTVVAFGFHFWPEIREHWPMSVVMILGSLVAGSTPMGGGTVAFPVLVLLFDQVPANARNFGMMIQSVGMTSALIFIVGRGTPLPFRLLVASSLGAAAGLMLGTSFIAPQIQNSLVKLLFACLWMSFGLLILTRNIEICRLKGKGPPPGSSTETIGLVAGLIGGILVSMIGVGVEMCIYAVMVLVYRTDLRIAIPTAVSAAALASVAGALLHLRMGDVDHEALMNWLAAAPIVIFGAPIGAWLAGRLPRVKVLYFVSGLCVFQFLWTLQQTARAPAEWIFVTAAMAIGLALLYALYKTGKHIEKRAAVHHVAAEVVH